MRKGIAGTALIAGLIFAMWGITPSCTHDAPDAALFDTVCFDREVLPVFQNSCSIKDCHADREHPRLGTYEEIRRTVTPGAPEKSESYQRITANLILPMPPDHAIPEADRIRIRLWIAQGAEHTICTDSLVQPLNTGGVK